MGTDTQFAFTAELSQAQLTAIVRQIGRRRVWVYRAFGLIVALYGLVVLELVDKAFALFMIAFGILGAIGFPVLQVRRAVRRLRKMFDGPISYQIDAEGVRTTSRFSDGIVRWPLIDRLDQLSDVLLLWVGKVRIIPVVVGQLSPDTRAALAAFVRSHLSAEPAP